MRGVGWAGSFRGNAFTFTTVSRDSHQRRNRRRPKWPMGMGEVRRDPLRFRSDE